MELVEAQVLQEHLVFLELMVLQVHPELPVHLVSLVSMVLAVLQEQPVLAEHQVLQEQAEYQE